jgi:hypothetical protein
MISVAFFALERSYQIVHKPSAVVTLIRMSFKDQFLTTCLIYSGLGRCGRMVDGSPAGTYTALYTAFTYMLRQALAPALHSHHNQLLRGE